MSDTPPILDHLADGVLTLTLDRDVYRNALSVEIMDGIVPLLEEAAADDNVRVVVIAANGKCFCAGAKLDTMSDQQEAIVARKFHGRGRRMFTTILEFPKPTIAKVQGHALAGGCGLATACDFVISQEGAQFGYPEIEVAASPSIVMQILLRRVPWRIGMEWSMRGGRIEGSEAKRWGLINDVVAPGELDKTVDDLAAELAGRDPGALSVIKELGLVGPDMSLNPSLRYATGMSAIASSAPASREAIAGFFDRSKK